MPLLRIWFLSEITYRTRYDNAFEQLVESEGCFVFTNGLVVAFDMYHFGPETNIRRRRSYSGLFDLVFAYVLFLSFAKKQAFCKLAWNRRATGLSVV